VRQKNSYARADAGRKTSWRRFLTTPAQFFTGERFSRRLLRCDCDVFEGEELFETPACWRCETRRSSGRNIGVWRSKSTKRGAYRYDALQRRKFRQIRNFLSRYLYQDQTASAVCLAAWRAEARRAASATGCAAGPTRSSSAASSHGGSARCSCCRRSCPCSAQAHRGSANRAVPRQTGD